VSVSINEIQALKKALLHCNKELVVKGIGVFKTSYKAASLSSDGRTIAQPRYGWSFCLGAPAYLSASSTEFLASETLASSLIAASAKGESFEIAGLGLFYKKQGHYELMPEPGHLTAANQHYGLMPLSIHKVRTVLTSDLRPPKKATLAPSNLILKAAAVFLGFLLLSMLAFQYFLTETPMFTRQEAGMNIFGAERETLYQAPFISEPNSNIEDILVGIKQAADSVLFEKSMANETVALSKEPLLKSAPIVKSDGNLLLKSKVLLSSKINEQATEKEQISVKQKEEATSVQSDANREVAPPRLVKKAQEVTTSATASKSRVIQPINPKSSLPQNQSENNAGYKKEKQANAALNKGSSAYVVVGAFLSLQNAENYKAEMKAKGFQIADDKSVLIGKFHRVVVVSPSPTGLAQDFLAKAKKEISADVWLLKD
jgi:cell division septation protein DedD